MVVGSSLSKSVSLQNESDCGLHYNLVVDETEIGSFSEQNLHKDSKGNYSRKIFCLNQESYSSLSIRIFLIKITLFLVSCIYPLFVIALELREGKGFLPARSRKSIEFRVQPTKRCKYVCKILCQLMSSKDTGEVSIH